jgi:hypothetical protein
MNVNIALYLWVPVLLSLVFNSVAPIATMWLVQALFVTIFVRGNIERVDDT